MPDTGCYCTRLAGPCIHDLIEASSLGTPAARRIRQRANEVGLHLTGMAEEQAEWDDERCGSCDGARWVDDENWSPESPESWRGERTPGEGRIPCGSCNHGGWHIDDGAEAVGHG